MAWTTGTKACLLYGRVDIAAVTLIDSTGQVMSAGAQGDGPDGLALLQPGLTVPGAAPSLGPLGYGLTIGYGYEEVRVSGFCDAARTAAAVGVKMNRLPEVRLTVPPLPATSCSTEMGRW